MTTFVLIPGAGGDASFWDGLLPLLRTAGHTAVAVDLPGADEHSGLADYAGLVVAAAAQQPEIVLVAQSLGGFTAPLVAARVPARAVVFVNAMIPEPGESPGAWFDHTRAEQARIAAARRAGYAEEYDPDVYFLHDVPPAVLAAAPPPRTESAAVFGSVCDFTSWPAVPLRVVTGRDDRLFPLDFQRSVARTRLAVEPDVLPGGHLLAMSRPEPLADYLLHV